MGRAKEWRRDVRAGASPVSEEVHGKWMSISPDNAIVGFTFVYLLLIMRTFIRNRSHTALRLGNSNRLRNANT